MLRIDDLVDTHACVDGKWVIARPLKDRLFQRIKDAWKVVTGKADAVMFYKQ